MGLSKSIKIERNNSAQTVKKRSRLFAMEPAGETRRLMVKSEAQMKDFALDVGIDPFCSQLGEGTSEWRALQLFSGALTANNISLNAPLHLRATSFPTSLILGMCQSAEKMSINGQTVKSRDCFLIMPGAQFDVFTRKPAKLSLVTISVSKTEAEASDLYRTLLQSIDDRQVYVGGGSTANRQFRRWFQTWEAVSARRNNSLRTSMMPLLSEIVLPSLKLIAQDMQRRIDEGITDSDWSDSGIKRLIDYFLDNPEEWVSIEQACDISDFGRRNLYYQFNEQTGLSPQKYFAKIRLSYLREELICGDQSVTELALKYGFHHLGDFSATYKTVYGESPSRTRKNSRKTRQKISRERHKPRPVSVPISNG